jgi:hypothetical protein
MDARVIRALEELGHPVKPVAPGGATNGVAQPEPTGPLIGASEPRGEGKAADTNHGAQSAAPAAPLAKPRGPRWRFGPP